MLCFHKKKRNFSRKLVVSYLINMEIVKVCINFYNFTICLKIVINLFVLVWRRSFFSLVHVNEEAFGMKMINFIFFYVVYFLWWIVKMAKLD